MHAVVRAHQALEILLGYIYSAERLDADSEYKLKKAGQPAAWELELHVPAFLELPMPTDVKKLRSARNSAVHSALAPAQRDSQRLSVAAIAFAEAVVAKHWDTDLFAVSKTALVSDGLSRSWLERAEKLLDDKSTDPLLDDTGSVVYVRDGDDHRDRCLLAVALARFAYKRCMHGISTKQVDATAQRMEDTARRFGERGPLPSELSRHVGALVREISEFMRANVTVNMACALGVDLASLQDFFETPKANVVRNPYGEWCISFGGGEISRESATKAVTFTTDWILRAQGFVAYAQPYPAMERWDT